MPGQGDATVEVAVRGRRGPRPDLRVALVHPPVVVQVQGLSGKGPVPPIGLAYIAGAVRAAGHRVQVVDGTGDAIDAREDYETPVGVLRRIGLSPEEIVERIDPDVDLVGITHLFLHEWPHVREIAELARARFPDVPIVLGGENATAFWGEAFRQCPAVDACVLGEGEQTIVEVLDLVAQRRPFGHLSGVAVREGSRWAAPSTDAPSLPTRIRDLASVARPAWDLLPIEAYLRQGDAMGVHRGRSMPVLATRGCPYRCTFCSSPQMWTTRYSVREPADVVDEIAGYVERYGVRNVNFCDLTAITKRSWTLRFCDELDRRGLDITWQIPAGTRAEALDAEVLGRLYATGCRNLTYAPESGSTRMLELYDKRVDLDALLASVREAHRVGIRTHLNLIIGHPAEQWSDLRATARLLVRAARAGCDTVSPIMFGPYPGSADFDALVESGRLEVDEAYCYVGLSRGSAAHRSYHPTMTARQLRWVQLAMVAGFHGLSVLLRPSRLVHIVRSQVTGREADHLDQLLRIKRAQRAEGRRRRPSAPAAAPLGRAS